MLSRVALPAITLSLGACRGRDDTPASRGALPAVPRVARAFVGDWLRVAPQRLRGDTLRLRADSTADGIIPWPPDRLARVSRWKLRFGSKDPVDARGDWREGFTDGGEADCVMRDDAACISMPLLCLGAAVEVMCNAFVVTSDSLLLADGQRFRRVPARLASGSFSRSPSASSTAACDGCCCSGTPDARRTASTSISGPCGCSRPPASSTAAMAGRTSQR